MRKMLAIILGSFLAAPLGPLALAQTPEPAAPEAPPVPPGRSSVAWLGIFLGDAPDGGVQLVEIAPGGPAQKAGLRPGDVVIRLNGQEVVDRDALRVRLARLHPGDRVSVEILREGRSETRSVQAAERQTPAWENPVPWEPIESDRGRGFALLAPRALGARLAAIPSDLRVLYGAPADAGVLVVRVETRGAARAGGVEVGDVIVRVDGKVVRDPGELAFLSSARIVEVVRKGKPRLLRVPEDEDRSPRERRELERTILELKQRLAELERRLEALKEEE